MSLDSSENQVKIKCSLNIIVMIYWVIVLVIMTIYNDKLDRYIPNIDTKSHNRVSDGLLYLSWLLTKAGHNDTRMFSK